MRVACKPHLSFAGRMDVGPIAEVNLIGLSEPTKGDTNVKPSSSRRPVQENDHRAEMRRHWQGCRLRLVVRVYLPAYFRRNLSRSFTWRAAARASGNQQQILGIRVPRKPQSGCCARPAALRLHGGSEQLFETRHERVKPRTEPAHEVGAGLLVQPYQLTVLHSAPDDPFFTGSRTAFQDELPAVLQ
jgi:hypothetical protein